MIAEGKITIDLGADGAVRIVSNRTASVASLLIGRKPEEALSLLPVVFSLCAHAHGNAARAAMGQSPKAGDTMLVLAENAREHLLRIMLGWKVGTDVLMPAPPVMALVPEMQKAINDNTQMQVTDSLESYLTDHVFGCNPAQFLQIETISNFAVWLAETATPTGTYLTNITAKNWSDLGAIEAVYLPQLPSQQLALRMRNRDFCLQPDWLGAPCETGPLARHSAVPLVAAIIHEHGAGLLARLVARLVELAQIPAQMRAGGRNSSAQNGIGVVETARGRLIHTAVVRDGTIVDYSILAPTEWNFHPNGAAAQALSGLGVTQAKAVIEAIDPCIDFELKVA